MPDVGARLGEWYKENKRDLPWRDSGNAYHIWLSEVILQQTQVKQGLPYYIRFVEQYPDVYKLADADEEDILNLWQGLGYYSRALNLHQCAKQVVAQFKGEFPKDVEELKLLKGIGDYTAAAIASIAFDREVAVVDGNVYRVLSRLFNLETPINSSKGVRVFKELAQSLIHGNPPGDHNQALMDFGALVCTPKNPRCDSCVFFTQCEARRAGTIGERPLKLRKTKVQEKWHYYYVVLAENHVLIQKRGDKGIWKNMYDFPNSVSKSNEEHADLQPPLHLPPGAKFLREYQLIHILSHQKIHAQFRVIECDIMFEPIQKNQFWAHRNELQNYPWPRLMDKFLDSLTKTA